MRVLDVEHFLNSKSAISGGQTHTWFAAGDGSRSKTLTMTTVEVNTIKDALFQLIQNNKAGIKAWNSLTDKVRKDKPSKGFADFDWKLKALIERYEKELDTKDLGVITTAIRKDIIEFLAHLTKELAKLTERPDLQVHVAHRLDYKLHLHMPELIVNVDTQQALMRFISDTLEHWKNGILYFDLVVDQSVCNSGLRWIWCHKGAMVPPRKQAAAAEEKQLHIDTYGPNSFREFYKLVNPKTFKELKYERNHLDLTCIILDSEDTTTKANFEYDHQKATKCSKKKSTKGKNATVDDTETREVVSSTSACPINQAVLDWVNETFKTREFAATQVLYKKKEQCYVCPLPKLLYCSFQRKKHSSNHQYIVLKDAKAFQKCHDEECQKKKQKSDEVIVPPGIWEALTKKYELNMEEIDQELIEQAKKEAAMYVNSTFTGNDDIQMDLVQSDDVINSLRGQLKNLTDCTSLGHTCQNPSIHATVTQCKYHKNNCTMGADCTGCEWKYPKYGTLTIPMEAANFLSQLFLQVNNQTNNYNNYYGNSTNVFSVISQHEYMNDSYNPFHTQSPILNALFKKTFVGGHIELGNFFNEYYKDVIYYDKVGGIWYCFDSETKRWTIDRDGIDIRHFFLSAESVKIAYLEAYQHYSTKASDIAKRLTKNAQLLNSNLSNQKELSNILAGCKAPMAKGFDKFFEQLNQNAYLLGFDNGVYDLESNEFRQLEKDDYISYSTGYDYNPSTPELKQEVMECIQKILPVPEVCRYVLKLLASCLSGDTSNQLFHILLGEGSNGKSTLLKLMEKTLGPVYSGNMKTSYLTQKNPPSQDATPDITQVRNCRFVSLQEANRDEKLNEAMVKLLTGGDAVTFRRLYRESESFRPQFKLVMCSNHVVEIQGTDHGIWRRIRMIHFGSTFKESATEDDYVNNVYVADIALETKVNTIWRLPFLEILLEHYQIWKQEGLKDVPDEIDKFTRQYRSEMNVYETFLNDECEIHTNSNEFVERKKLELHFFAWLNRSDFSKRTDLKPKAFKKEMSQRFGKGEPRDDIKKHVNGKLEYVYMNVTIKIPAILS